MQVTVPAEIFQRFAALARNLPFDYPKPYLRSVLIEVWQNKAFIFATDSKFAAVQFLGTNVAGEGKVCIAAGDALFDQVTIEKSFASSVIVSDFSVSTSLGYVEHMPFTASPQGVVNELFTWRKLFAEGNGASGSMFIDVDRFEFMQKTSPSGKVIFPSKINSESPIVIKDAVDSAWLGVFIGRAEKGNDTYGKLPEWLNV